MQQSTRKWLVSLALPLALTLTLGLGGCSSSSDPAPAAPATPSAPEPTPEPTLDPLATNYLGSATCKMCHTEQHSEWKSSWHTRKTTWGPAATQAATATAFRASKTFAEHKDDAQVKFLPGVKEMWENGEIASHMILDRAPLTDADKEAGITDKNYVTKKKYHWSEVEIIIGETRKQRYAVYYDGKPVEEAHYSTSKNSGIGWEVDTSVTVSYAGNLERAGYKFLTVEMDALKNPVVQKPAMYGTWRSWQEQCIGCHTTGFDPEAWNAAKAAYVASEGTEGDLRGVYITEIEISCEACHGPGREHAEYKLMKTGTDTIINPKKLSWSDPTRKMVCEQCHTRAQTNLAYGNGANDNRGFVLGEHDYMDVMQYTRPDWSKGNRQVSLDGKGRRDHQQDMDIRLSNYARNGISYHSLLACFDCHDSHNVGNAAVAGDVVYSTELADKTLFTTSTGATPDPTGLVRLNKTREQLCSGCHGGEWENYLAVFDGATGWAGTSYPDYASYRGRANKNQHIFRADGVAQDASPLGRSQGLDPNQYTWGQLSNGNWEAIWPWEKDLPRYVATHTGATAPTN